MPARSNRPAPRIKSSNQGSQQAAPRLGGGLPVPDNGPAVAADGITKYYGLLAANREVSVAIGKGRVHALVGENGAGKSTFAKILAGAIRPTSGTIVVGGSEVELQSTRDGLALGIGMVPQHPALIPEMTVVDNCLFGHRSSKQWVVPREETHRELAELGEPLGFALELDVPVAELSLGERQRAEILRLLRRKANTLILDEPTDVLSPGETDRLFEALRVIVGGGATVIVITHRLSEVFEIADDVTVLRDGQVAGHGQIDSLDESQLIQWMLGREYSPPVHRTEATEARDVLTVSDLSTEGRIPIRQASLRVAGGEIVGIAGVDGNGQEELAGAIAGTLPPTAGHVELAGRSLDGATAAERNRAGLGYIPADRQREGLVLDMSVCENISLRRFQAGGSEGGVVRMATLRSDADRLVRHHGIKCESVNVPVASLSGGNQQKVIVARELGTRPEVLIAAQPTRGLDIAARDSVHTELLSLTRDGSGVLLISSDLDEILRLADRLVVLARGELVAEFKGPDYDVTAIGRAMAADRPRSPEVSAGA